MRGEPRQSSLTIGIKALWHLRASDTSSSDFIGRQGLILDERLQGLQGRGQDIQGNVTTSTCLLARANKRDCHGAGCCDGCFFDCCFFSACFVLSGIRRAGILVGLHRTNHIIKCNLRVFLSCTGQGLPCTTKVFQSSKIIIDFRVRSSFSWVRRKGAKAICGVEVHTF